jgi:GT2 family glycosyltransferase
MNVSLLVVNYRSSALAVDAIRSARAATSSPLQVVVVDNSVDAAEAEALRPHADALIVSDYNAGYAAAINRGRRACDGDVIVVTNPDVVFAPNAIDHLADANASVAGPALFWDDAHEWLLPPSDLHTFRDRLDHALGTRSAKHRRRRDRRRFFERLAFAALTQPARVPSISGAVMAIRTDAEFDERFRLYFEETDFVRRAGGATYVPAARCRHLYNQSAGASREAAQLYAMSEREYLRKWSGAFAPSIIKALELPELQIEVDSVDGPIDVREPDAVVVEASPLASFETAAIHVPRLRHVDLPREVLSSYRGDSLYLRVVERHSGEVLATYRRTKISS